jgi:hypothetical protein
VVNERGGPPTGREEEPDDDGTGCTVGFAAEAKSEWLDAKAPVGR